MTKKVSEDLRDNRFVAPRSLITEKELESVDEMEKLDTEYRNRYVKPIMMKTLQLGVKLPFDLSYQSGSGAFAAILYGFLMFLGYVVRILPEGMIRVTDLGSQSVTWTSMGITFYGIGMDWFIIGLSTWTLFTTLLCAIQASGNPLKVRPFELMKERFNPLSELILKMTITVTFVVAWASPFIMLWSILPPDPLSRQYAVYFTEVMLTILIPIIVASFVIPSFAVHKGLIRSRDRLLFIKDFELDAIKKIRESEPDKYIKIQQHLISDYKDIQSNSPWLFNFSQVLQLAVSVVLPIVSFWLTIQLK